MAAVLQESGSAHRWGPVWGARAHDWAASEVRQVPTYEEAIRRVGIGAGQRVLELGCGSGVFLRLAADRGAEVFGLDASEALIELARSRVPEADLRVGDMQFLPSRTTCSTSSPGSTPSSSRPTWSRRCGRPAASPSRGRPSSSRSGGALSTARWRR